MLEVFRNPAYDFIGWRHWAYGVSAALMLLGLGSILAKGGLRYDVDFTGGTLVEVRLARAMPVGTIRSQLTEAGLGESIIQVFGDPRDVLIRTHTAKTDAAELSRRVADALGGHGVGAAEIRRVEYVGPQIGQELRRQALYAVLAALAGILLYIWMRFDLRGGVVTIVSVAHDVLICRRVPRGLCLPGPGRLAHRDIVHGVCRGRARRGLVGMARAPAGRAHRGRRPGRAGHATVTRSEVG